MKRFLLHKYLMMFWYEKAFQTEEIVKYQLWDSDVIFSLSIEFAAGFGTVMPISQSLHRICGQFWDRMSFSTFPSWFWCSYVDFPKRQSNSPPVLTQLCHSRPSSGIIMSFSTCFRLSSHFRFGKIQTFETWIFLRNH